MAIARKVAYNVAVSSVSKVFSTILALVAIGFVTRYLGKDGFGDYATVLAFLALFAAIADLGLYHIATREISREGSDEEKIIGNIFSLRIISATVVVLFSPIIVFFFDYSPMVKLGVVIAASSYIFSSSYQVLNGVFQKNLAMDKVAIGELIGKVIQVTTIIIAVKYNLGFSWVISSLLFNMIASFTIIYIWSRKYIRFKLRFDFSYWKSFLKESLPIGIGSIIVFIYFKIDTIFLSVMKTNSDVGIYNAAYKVVENIIFFPSMVVGLVLPIMSNTINSSKEKFVDVANKTFKFFIILVVPLIIGTLFLSDGIINLIGGGQFAQSASVLRILVFALSSIFFGVFFNNILIAGNLQKKLLWVWSSGAIINVVLNLIFIPKYSYFASAYISFITEFFVACASFYFVYSKLNYKPKLDNYSGIILSGFFMIGFLYLFELPFLLMAILSATIYLVSLWIFKTIKTSEILSLISKKGIEEYEEIS